MQAPDLPPCLARDLRRYVSRRRGVALVRGAGLAVAGALLLLVATGLLDRLVPLHHGVRLAMLLAAALAVPWALWRPLRRVAGRRADWIAASRQIEQLDPALGQRLVTVVSQAVAAPAHRGSSMLLATLQQQVIDHFASHPPIALVSLRQAALPWLVAALALVLVWALCAVPSLDMPTLILRAVAPLADVPPVTATKLAVSPGSATVEAGQVVTIRALAQPLPPEPPSLRTSLDRRNWSHSPMFPAADGAYVCSLPPAQHDLWYQVRAGDASCPAYRLNVLRRPAVAHLRVRLQYPQHASLAPQPASEHLKGPIEGPEGTTVHLEIVATEPLASATVMLGTRQIPTQATPQANVRLASFVITDSQPLIVEMISTGNVPGRGPAGVSVNRLPDAAPLVRVSRPKGELLLAPPGSVDLHYSVTDDFGIASLSLAVQVNTRPAVNLPLPLEPGSRQATGRCDPMSCIGLPSPGDLVQIELVATDTRGQVARSNPLSLLVAPSAPTAAMRELASSLGLAAGHARTLADDLGRCARGIEQLSAADPTDAQRLAGLLALARNIASANHRLAAMRAAILEAAAVNDAPGWTGGLEALTGQVHRLGDAMAWLDFEARQWGSEVAPTMLREAADRARRTLSAVAEFAQHLATIADGLRSQLVLDQLAALSEAECAAPDAPAAHPRFGDAIRRLRQAMEGEVRQMGLSPRQADLEALLRRRALAARSAVAAGGPPASTRPRHVADDAQVRPGDTGGPRPPQAQLPADIPAPQSLRDAVRAYFQSLERSSTP